jgi:S1-C subfamily serine protease
MTPIRIVALVLLAVLACAERLQAQAELTRVRQGVVRILVFVPDSTAEGGLRLKSGGSGFVINDAGTIITNWHVIDDVVSGPGKVVIHHAQDMEDVARQLTASGATSREAVNAAMAPKAIEATVAWSDRRKDLAILKPAAVGPGRPLSLVPRRFVEQGDKVRALGYPGINDALGPRAELVLSQQPGEISSDYFHERMGVPVYHISANMYHGMSGGPLVNECGEVVGVDGPGRIESARQNDIDRAIYSIQVDALTPILDEHRLAYTTVSNRCAAARSSGGGGGDSVPFRDASASGRDPLLTLGVIGALLLAGAAVVLAFTNRGRTAVKAVAESVTQRLGRRPPNAGAKGAIPPQQMQGGAGALDRRGETPTLYGVSGEYAGVELELSDEPVVIGRDPRVSQLVFSADTAGVSGRHCSIWFDPTRQKVLVQDLWSSHGTFLESGERLVSGEPRALVSADQFYLADPDVLFEVRY